MLPVLNEHQKIIGLVLDIKKDLKGIRFFLGVNEETNKQFLSAGFNVLKSYKDSNNINCITSLNLKEVSFVFSAAQGETLCKQIL